ncbi:hypothetical protein SAY87_014591 [Trapa incisa]|uniref:Uncharacterized protein n=1 Tax=Trapa incisa TaxID=236973 RepID=A0AAN7GX23_9MYRT|nr:hypothetical protein SAY87_014591 [Trapa incisa]
MHDAGERCPQQYRHRLWRHLAEVSQQYLLRLVACGGDSDGSIGFGSAVYQSASFIFRNQKLFDGLPHL